MAALRKHRANRKKLTVRLGLIELSARGQSQRMASRLETTRYQRTIMPAAMTAAMTTMMTIINGLLSMCRSMANLVPSGSKSMPHFGHFPGFG